MQRRQFIKLASLGSGAVLTGSAVTTLLPGCKKDFRLGLQTKPVPVTEAAFTNPLVFPAQAGTNATLAAQITTANVKGNTISVLGYQPNRLLGPTFRVNRGDNLSIQLQNRLAEHTNIHWHGLIVPPLMDGHPDQLAEVGGSFSYQFTINQRAGMSWYHPHPHGMTGKQVFQGLAGVFIINDAEEAALNLPSGPYELPMILQDKRITSTGIPYEPSMEEVMAGYMGETVLVNGVHAPFAEVATRYYRLRILNGSNARIYNLALSNNDDLVIIGNDGGLLKTPAPVKEILLAPGERLDVLVNFKNATVGTTVNLISKEFSNAGDAQGKQAFQIMQFKVVTPAADAFAVPAVLSAITDLQASAAVPTRVFEISNAMEHHGVPMNNGMRMRHRINGNLYDGNRVDITLARNTQEVWVFDNSKGDEPHPMHLHGVFFQVLKRTGGRAAMLESEKGWKDTVLVMPGEVVHIIIPFGAVTGRFVFHCHNLEHEDDGMMLQYQLT